MHSFSPVKSKKISPCRTNVSLCLFSLEAPSVENSKETGGNRKSRKKLQNWGGPGRWEERRCVLFPGSSTHFHFPSPCSLSFNLFPFPIRTKRKKPLWKTPFLPCSKSIFCFLEKKNSLEIMLPQGQNYKTLEKYECFWKHVSSFFQGLILTQLNQEIFKL